MQPITPPIEADPLSIKAHNAAEVFGTGDMHAALQEVQNDTIGLNSQQLQKFYTSLAYEAQRSANHLLPGLEITQEPPDQLKVVAHDGTKIQTLYDNGHPGTSSLEPSSSEKAQKSTADIEEEQKSPPVRLGEGYYQPLKRMHPDWTHKQLMDKIHEIKARLGYDHVLRVGERFDTMSPEEKKTAIATRTGQPGEQKGTPEQKPPDHPGQKGPEAPSRPPEKTADGGTTTYDAQGNATTRWDNGVVRVQNKDGTGYVQTPDGKGGYHENHWGPKSSDNFETDRKIEDKGGADAAFDKRVGDAYANLPEGVRKKLDQAGIHIVTAGKTTDVHPEWKGQHPRGYPPGVDYSAVDGVFDGTNIIVPEHSDSQTKPDPEGVLRHEAGHAFDKVLGDYSHSVEFNDAYQKDIAKLTPEQRQQLQYYLQKEGAGQEELFAELFCSATGGRPDKDHYPLDMAKLFPETYKLVQKKINEAQ